MALARKHGPGKLKPIVVAIAASCTALAMAAPPAPTELPAGGRVTAGNAVISQSAANLTVDQSSNRAIINWNTFNVGSQASVVFNQPGAAAVTLNRVLSSDPSAIYGRLSANGQVFLVNPAGIVFGPGSSVNTAGFVASTLSLSDQNFMSGNYRFERNGSTGGILNQGTITSNNGYVALLAPEVRNEGVISANLGTVALAAGETVTLSFDAANQLKVAVDPSTLKTLIENNHLIRADGGTVLMASSAAANVLGSVIRNTGVIEANSIGHVNGEIVLYAANGTTLHDDGGRIEARGIGEGQTGGTVKLLGDRVGMLGNASIDASGAAGGGTVLVGGDFQGKNPDILNASRNYIGPDAMIKADALINGDGGKVIVWSDYLTGFYGSIQARGGKLGGNGGLVETSGKPFLVAVGHVDASAPNGIGGNWLLDPYSVTISNDPPPIPIGSVFNPITDNANVNAGAIQTALNNGTSVIITTIPASAVTCDGGCIGNINVAGTEAPNREVNILKSAGGNASLTLQAAGSIFVNNGANISSTSGALNVTLNTRNDGGSPSDAGGIVINGATIQSNGGNIVLGGGVDPLTTPAIGTGTAVDGIRLTGARLSSGAGNISLFGQGRAGSATSRGLVLGGATILDTTSGTISVTGIGGAAGTANNVALQVEGGTRLNAASGASGNIHLAARNGALSFGDAVMSGNLVATADGAISQIAGTALTVTGTANINANNQSITLNNTGNHFEGQATFIGSSVSVADSAALNAVLDGTGQATLSAATAMTISGRAAGVQAYAGTTMAVDTAGLNGGAGAVLLVSAGDLKLLGPVSSGAVGDSVTLAPVTFAPITFAPVTLASIAGNFYNVAGSNSVRAGRFLTYSDLPQRDILGGLTAPNLQFSTRFGDAIPFTGSGFLYRGSRFIVDSDPPPSGNPPGNFVPSPVPPDLAAPLGVFVADTLRVGSLIPDADSKELCWTPSDDKPCESEQRKARKARYKEAIELLRKDPTAADIPMCAPNAVPSDICMPAKTVTGANDPSDASEIAIPVADVRKKVAVLFGSNEYADNGKGIDNLKTPIADVSAIGKVLAERFGYEVTIVQNATKAELVLTLKKLSEQVTQNESVLIFYAGHGYQEDNPKAAYWIPTDARASDGKTWLSNNDIHRFLNRIEAKQIILVADSCFSGTLTKEQAIDAPRTTPRAQLLTRRAVVTFSSGDEEPVSDGGGSGHSVFAYHLLGELERIQEMTPASVAHERLRELIGKTHKQTPQVGAVPSAGHMTGANYMFEVK